MTLIPPMHTPNPEGTATALPFGPLFPAVSDMGPKLAFQRAETGRLSTIGGSSGWRGHQCTQTGPVPREFGRES